MSQATARRWAFAAVLVLSLGVAALELAFSGAALAQAVGLVTDLVGDSRPVKARFMAAIIAQRKGLFGNQYALDEALRFAVRLQPAFRAPYVTCVYTQIAYNSTVKAVFVELPAFQRYRAGYLDDLAYGSLQQTLMKNPEAGEVVEGTGGLRKMRFADARRGKGKRGGLRVIYYWWSSGLQFWLYTLYDKDEMADLSPKQRKALKAMIKAELESRRAT